MTLDYVRLDGSHGTLTVSGNYPLPVSLVKRETATRYPEPKLYNVFGNAVRVELSGNLTRRAWGQDATTPEEAYALNDRKPLVWLG